MVVHTALSPSPQWPAAALEGTLPSSTESWPAPSYPFFPEEVIGVAIVAASGFHVLLALLAAPRKLLARGIFFLFRFATLLVPLASGSEAFLGQWATGPKGLPCGFQSLAQLGSLEF